MEVLTDEQRKMVEANMGLVGFVMDKYFKHAIADRNIFDDYYNNGSMGLMRAVQKFEPERGFRFSTYAVQWIRSFIQRGHLFMEDVNYRYANDRKLRGETEEIDYDVPLSLDYEREKDGTAFGTVNSEDLAVAPFCTEDVAISNMEYADVLSVARACCNDEFDHAIIDALVNDQPTGALAKDFGYKDPDVVYRRKQQIKIRIQELELISA